MKRFLPGLATISIFAAALFAQPIPSGARLFIDPMDGFENYLTAALLAKRVPVTVVGDKAHADYVAAGTFKHEAASSSGWVSIIRPAHNQTNYSASVSIIDQKTVVGQFDLLALLIWSFMCATLFLSCQNAQARPQTP